MQGIGGSYRIEKGSKAKRVHGTEEHPDGNRPRAADGTPLDGDPHPNLPRQLRPARTPEGGLSHVSQVA